jgi:hypothetical protein
MRQILPIILIASLLSCTRAQSLQSNPAAPIDLATATDSHPRLELQSVLFAKAGEAERINEALLTANRRLASKCFKDAVLNARYTETLGLSQAQIYGMLSQSPSRLTVELFDGSWIENHIWKTMAYDGDGSHIRINRFFLKTDETIAGTMVHERLGHGYGFMHKGVKRTSVPYGIQNALEACK